MTHHFDPTPDPQRKEDSALSFPRPPHVTHFLTRLPNTEEYGQHPKMVDFLRVLALEEIQPSVALHLWNVYRNTDLAPESLNCLLRIARKEAPVAFGIMTALATYLSNHPDAFRQISGPSRPPPLLVDLATALGPIKSGDDATSIAMVLMERARDPDAAPRVMKQLAIIAETLGGAPANALRTCVAATIRIEGGDSQNISSIASSTLSHAKALREALGVADSEHILSLLQRESPVVTNRLLATISEIRATHRDLAPSYFVSDYAFGVDAPPSRGRAIVAVLGILAALPANSEEYSRATHIFSTYIKQGWDISPILSVLSHMASNPTPNNVPWRNALAALRNVSASSPPPILPDLSTLPLLGDTGVDAVVGCFQKPRSPELTRSILTMVERRPAFTRLPVHLVRRFHAALDSGLCPNEIDVNTLSMHLCVRQILLELVAGKGSQTYDPRRAASDFSVLTTNDALPFRRNDLRAERMRQEIRRGFSRMLSHAYGFGHLTFDCRSFPDGDEWPIASAAHGLGAAVFHVNASSSHEFPGRGIYIRGIDPGRVYPAPEVNGTPDNEIFKSIVRPRGMDQEVDLLSRTGFLFTRGMIAVHPPRSHSKINGVEYTYVVFNEHFDNPTLELAYCVPTRVMQKLISPSLIPRGGVDSDSIRSTADVTKAVPHPRMLLAACLMANTEYLEIGSPSNLGGSFSNAHRPTSQPYHSWEARYPNETTDAYGHIHKSHLKGGYDPDMERISEDDLAPFRKAHSDNYQFLTRCANLLDLAFISLAHYDMGVTREAVEPFTEEDSAASASQPSMNPRSCRRLHQAYRWHTQLRDDQAPEDEFPVLALVPVLGESGALKPLLTLDTFTLTLTFFEGPHKGQKIQLPRDSNGRGYEEEATWIEMVVPLFKSTLALRPYHRRERGLPAHTTLRE